LDQHEKMKRQTKITATLDELATEVGAYLMLEGATPHTFNRCAFHILALRLHIQAVGTGEAVDTGKEKDID